MAEAIFTLKQPRKSILRPRRLAIIPLPLDLSQRIPPEVINLIIDSVAFCDLPTLTVCSRVCRAWLTASRARTYLTISLNETNLWRFVHLLDSPHSTLALGIRHVSIQYGSAGFACEASRGLELFEERMWRLIKFASLTSLCFSFLNCLNPHKICVLARGFPGLTDLEFRTCDFPSFTEFTGVVCALRNLRRISLSDIHWLDCTVPGSTLSQCIPRGLQTVELYLSPINHFCIWLANYSHVLLSLETFRFGSTSWDDRDAISVAWMLSKFAEQVKTLALPYHLPEIDLSYLTELRELHITHMSEGGLEEPLPAGERNEVESLVAREIRKTLQQLNSHHIMTIKYGMVLSDVQTLNLNWTSLEKTLARPCFTHLVEFTLGYRGIDKKFRALIQKLWGNGASRRQSPSTYRQAQQARYVEWVYGQT